MQCSKDNLHWPGSGDLVALTSRGCGGSEFPSCALWEASPLAKDREVYGLVSQNLTLSLSFCSAEFASQWEWQVLDVRWYRGFCF